LNNIIFAAFAFVVFLGTVFPLVAEALSGDRITVGAPYFERMTIPIGIVMLFLMAIAPVLPWRKASGETLSKRLIWPAWCGVGALAVAVLLGARGFAPLLAFLLAGFAGGAALRQLVLATRRQGLRGLLGRTNASMIVHLGVIMIDVALAASGAYDSERDPRMCVDAESGWPSTLTVDGHEITYLGDSVEPSGAATEIRTSFRVDGAVYTPALQQFPQGSQTIGRPTVKNTPTSSIMLSITDPPGDDSVAVKIIVQPLIEWLWIGGAVTAAGSLLARFPG